jgi:hypothetical protein
MFLTVMLKFLTVRALAIICLRKAKKFNRAVIFTMAYDKLFILCWRIYRTMRDFNVTYRTGPVAN